MKAYLVDTNVLLDVLGADKKYGPLSLHALNTCATQGILVINPIIFAEVGVYIPSLEELNTLLPETLFRRDTLPWEAAFLASQAFGRYKRNKQAKNRILADFLIGAHAACSDLSLISRDAGYLHYFKLDLINPEST